MLVNADVDGISLLSAVEMTNKFNKDGSCCVAPTDDLRFDDDEPILSIFFKTNSE